MKTQSANGLIALDRSSVALNVIGRIGVWGGTNMKIFISSVITGFEEFRDAVEASAKSLGHEVIRAEGFPASDTSSRIACLSGVRDADLVVMLVGARYGSSLPPKNISPTHEEFLEAKNEKPILVFLQEGVERDREQSGFVQLVESWSEGRHRGTFASAEELRDEVTRAIHEFELRSASAPIDIAALREDACRLLEVRGASWGSVGTPFLRIGVAGGPSTQVLRPRELEEKELEESTMKALLFGDRALFDRSLGTEVSLVNGVMQLTQSDGRAFSLFEQGSVALSLPIEGGGSGFPCIITESVERAIEDSLCLVADTLDHIDGAGRLSRLVVAAQVVGAEHIAWRSRMEHEASSNSMTYTSFSGGAGESVITRNPPDLARAALRYDRRDLAEDLAALLKRDAENEARGF